MAHRARAGYLTRSWHMVRVIICVCVAQCHGKAQDGRRGAVTLPNSLWGYYPGLPEVVGVPELFKCGILLRGSYLKFTPRLRLCPQIDCHTCAIPVCRAQEAPDYFPRNRHSPAYTWRRRRCTQGRSRLDSTSTPACRGVLWRSWAALIRPSRVRFGSAASGGRSRRPRRVWPIGVTPCLCKGRLHATIHPREEANLTRPVLRRAAAFSGALGLL